MPNPKLKFEVSESNAGQRLDLFVSEAAKVSRSQAKNWIDSAQVLVNGKEPRGSSAKVRLRDIVEVQQQEARALDLTPQKVSGVRIVFEDDSLAVLEKAAGISVHPSSTESAPTVVHSLLHELKSLSSVGGVERPGIVHRIDKGTSGLLVVSKTDAAHLSLSAQFKERSIDRRYNALTLGVPRETEGTIETVYGRHPKDRKKMTGKLTPSQSSRRAITHWKVIERFQRFALVECKLDTGRTHQIRVHLSEMGYPIVGDQIYGSKAKNSLLSSMLGIDHQLLHARTLEFTHPATNKRMKFESELPEDFATVLKELRTSAK